jgi:DNA-binding transcriptional LysR family regulator
MMMAWAPGPTLVAISMTSLLQKGSTRAAPLEQGDIDLFVGAAEDGSNELIASTLFEDEFVTAQRVGHPRGDKPFELVVFIY